MNTTADSSGNLHALSLWEPWASFVVAGIKTLETRHELFNTHHRGIMGICGSRREMPLGDDPIERVLLREFFEPLNAKMPDWEPYYGLLIGTVEVVDVYTVSGGKLISVTNEYRRLPMPVHPELRVGNFGEGRRIIETRKPKILKVPLKIRGFQSVFDTKIRIDTLEFLPEK